MADFPTVLTNAVDNTTYILAKHINNIEAKIGINSSAVSTSLDYKVSALASANTGTNTGDNATNSQYSGLASSKQNVLNGTGFVKIAGTSISYDNSSYLKIDRSNMPNATLNRTDGYLSSVVYSDGRTITITRDINNFITSMTDTVHTWTLTRNGSNQITALTIT